MNKIIFSSALFIASTYVGSTLFENSSSALSKVWGVNLSEPFSKLPENGEVGLNNFPSAATEFEGGINTRWEESNVPEKHVLLTKEDLLNLSPEALMIRLKHLSASEKFDLVRGRFDYPLTREEEKRLKLDENPSVALSRGWALAVTAVNDSLLLKPLKSIELLNKFFSHSFFQTLSLREPSHVKENLWISQNKKIEIPFGSSDVKSLISYYVGVRAWSKNSIHKNITEIGSNENELSAADFHQILSHTVGLQKTPLSISFYLDGKKTYEPIVKYDSTIQLEKNENGETQYLITTDFYSVKPTSRSYRALSSSGVVSHLRHHQSIYRVNGTSSEWIDGSRPSSVIRMSPVSLSSDFEKLADLYKEAK